METGECYTSGKMQQLNIQGKTKEELATEFIQEHEPIGFHRQRVRGDAQLFEEFISNWYQGK